MSPYNPYSQGDLIYWTPKGATIKTNPRETVYSILKCLEQYQFNRGSSVETAKEIFIALNRRGYLENTDLLDCCETYFNLSRTHARFIPSPEPATEELKIVHSHVKLNFFCEWCNKEVQTCSYVKDELEEQKVCLSCALENNLVTNEQAESVPPTIILWHQIKNST